MDEQQGSEDLISPDLPAEIANSSIDVLDLSTRTYNALKRSDITTIGQLLQLDENKLGSVRNLGQKSVDEIRQQLQAHGYQGGSVEAAGDT
jgi:DNA-directed RNA polymerase subunit alpha